MPTLAEQIEQSRREALVALAEAGNGAALEEWSIKYLGKKGQMTALFRGVGALPPEERAAAGGAASAHFGRSDTHDAQDCPADTIDCAGQDLPRRVHRPCPRGILQSDRGPCD